MTRTGTLISVFNLEGQKSIEAAGHQRELEITVNLHGHGRGQGIHMEKVNAIGDPIFNDHALCVATHQLGGGAAELGLPGPRSTFPTPYSELESHPNPLFDFFIWPFIQ